MMLIVAAVLVVLNGLFVAVEFSLVKSRETRLRELADQGRPSAKAALDTVQNLYKYLSAVQLGVTMASLGLGWVGEPAVARLIRPLFGAHTARAEAASHAFAVTIAFVSITFLEIVFGELTPKAIAIRQPERTAMILSLPLRAFYKLFYVPIYLLNVSANFVLRVLHLGPATPAETGLSEEELRMVLATSEEAGAIKKTEIDIIEQVLDFAHKTADDVMVPRVDMVYLDVTEPLEENVRIARESGHTRYPLCVEDADHVIGQIHVRDLFRLERDPEQGLESIRRDVMKVPETRPIDSILRDLQRNKMHLAVVVDEYGGTAGLITIEDIIEEIVGEIYDEFEQVRPLYQDMGHGRYIVDGRTRVDELPEEVQEDLQYPEGGTVGGIVLAALNRPPEVGVRAKSGYCDLEVTEVKEGRIAKLRLTCVKPEPPPTQDSED